MKVRKYISTVLGTTVIAGCTVAPSFARDRYAEQQYPPGNQQVQPPQPTSQGQPYPPQQSQYPQQEQYPQNPQQTQRPYPPGQYSPPEYNQPPILPPQQLDQLVQPIALYPDGLLAQVLTASTFSTFSSEIPDAAGWANAHAYLKGEALARAIQQDNLPWDPSVIGLLPFPSVLNYMAQYPEWTQELGNAVLSERPAVMDAVQRMRQEAYNYGYLRSNPYVRVVIMGPGDIEIVPVNPDVYYVPYYSPYVVFVPPRPGFSVGVAIRFGPSITLGVGFAPWGWGGVGFDWRAHTILIGHRPWGRTWVHPQAYVHSRVIGPRVERHNIRSRHGYGQQ